MPKTRLLRHEDMKSHNQSNYYNSAEVSIDPSNFETSKAFIESENGFCFLRVKTARGSVSLVMSKKQFSTFITKRERQRLKGKLQTIEGKPEEFKDNVSDYFYILVENIRRYNPKDEENIVRLKGRVVEKKENFKNRKNSISIMVEGQKFTCVTENNLQNVNVGDYAEVKAYLQCRDFYLGREVYKDSYAELLLCNIKVQ